MFVRKIEDLLEYIEKNFQKNIYKENENKITYFRGQSDAKWNLSPSLYRLKGNIIEKEKILINKVLHQKPTEFDGLPIFDILVKMQHYGLPTRLLDVTKNPLTALFFACHSVGTDGKIFIFNSAPSYWSNHEFLQVVMHFVFEINRNTTKQGLFESYSFSNKLLEHFSKNAEEIIKTLSSTPKIVISKFTNERIDRQDGAFLLFGMKINTTGNTLTFEPAIYDNASEINQQWDEIIIASENKSDILKKLDFLGINEHSLFPELDHQIKYIVEMEL